jgi:hypothetical protein
MPRKLINYSNIIIYKIICKNINIKECYIGHTTDFTDRKYKHKHSCTNVNNKNFNLYVYEFIRKNGDWINWDMVEIEKYNAIDKLDAHKRERYWIEFYNAELNSVIPARNYKERYIANKEEILIKAKEYREENKEKIANYKKDLYELNKEEILEYHKKYYEENKSNILDYQKKYRDENQDKIIDYKKNYREKNIDKIKEKMNCICGSICRKDMINRHEQSIKHIKFIKNIS